MGDAAPWRRSRRARRYGSVPCSSNSSWPRWWRCSPLPALVLGVRGLLRRRHGLSSDPSDRTSLIVVVVLRLLALVLLLGSAGLDAPVDHRRRDPGRRPARLRLRVLRPHGAARAAGAPPSAGATRDERVDQRPLHGGEPVVDRQLLVRLAGQLLGRLGVLADAQPGAQGQPQVVGGAQPRGGLVGVQPQLPPPAGSVARTMARSSALPATRLSRSVRGSPPPAPGRPGAPRAAAGPRPRRPRRRPRRRSSSCSSWSSSRPTMPASAGSRRATMLAALPAERLHRVLLVAGPQPVGVQPAGVVLHPLPGAGADDRLALVVHLEHQLGRLGLVVAEELLEARRSRRS